MVLVCCQAWFLPLVYSVWWLPMVVDGLAKWSYGVVEGMLSMVGIHGSLFFSFIPTFCLIVYFCFHVKDSGVDSFVM
jgi:hypothetical protein